MDIHPDAAPEAPRLRQMSREPELYDLSDFERRTLGAKASSIARREHPGPPCAGVLAVAAGELVFTVGLRGRRERVKRIPFSSIVSLKKKLIGSTILIQRTDGREDLYQTAEPAVIVTAFKAELEALTPASTDAAA